MRKIFDRRKLAADAPSILRKFDHWWSVSALEDATRTNDRETDILNRFLENHGFSMQKAFSITKDDYGNFSVFQPPEKEHWSNNQYAIVDVER